MAIEDKQQQRQQQQQPKKAKNSNDGKKLSENQLRFLNEQYYDPRNSASYSGFNKFWRHIRDLKIVTKIQTLHLLQQQDAYTSFRPNVQKFKRPKIVVPYYGYEFGSDTAYMVKFADENDGYKYFAVFIDYFTRFAWTYKLKTLKGVEMQTCMKRLFEEEQQKPEHLHTDKGTEYVNRVVSKYLKEQSVNHIVTGSDAKSSISEALIKQIKQKLFRYMYHKNTLNWHSVLDDVTRAYNNSTHSTLKMSPKAAQSAEPYVVWRNQHGLKTKKTPNSENKPPRRKRKARKPKQKQPFTYRINDRVKVSAAKTPFTRAYSEQFSTETFFVQRRKTRDGIAMYTLRDELGETIQGQFYEREMTPVIVPEDKQYKIERVISSKRIKGKKQFLVKWQNFPSKYNSYVSEEDLVDIR